MRDDEIIEVDPPEMVGYTVFSFTKRNDASSAFR